jgi:hypothetical protein
VHSSYSSLNPSVLFVADLFHPVDNLAIELFLNGDVRHGGGQRSAMPVLLAGREPDHIAGPDFLNRTSPALCPAATGGDDQGLAERMRVPCSPRARLESYTGALNQCRIGCLEQWIDADRACEPILRPFTPPSALAVAMPRR